MKTKKKTMITRTAMCLGVAILLGACQSMDTKLGSRFEDNNANVMNSTYLYESGISAALNERISVDKEGSERTPGGTLRAYSMLRNRTEAVLTLEARTLFFDGQKKLAEDASGWKRLYLDPLSIEQYEENSLSAEAARFYRIEVREVR